MRYRFSLERRKKDGKLVTDNMPIRISLNHNGKRKTLSSGFRVDEKQWDEKKEQVKQGYVNKDGEYYNKINETLAQQKSFFDNYILQCNLDKKEIDLDELNVNFAQNFTRKSGNNVIKESNSNDFFKRLDQFTNEEGRLRSWTSGTYEKFKAASNHLYEFDKNLQFDSLNVVKLMDYLDFLLHERHMFNPSAKKHLEYLNWFLNWAYKKGYLKSKLYKEFNPRLKIVDNPVVYLSKNDLEKIRSVKIPDNKQHLDRVRDVLLFCCLTSLRHSDVLKIKKTDIKDNILHLVTRKDVDALRIKIVSRAKSILEKYEDFKLEDGRLLPVISNQKMNDYLKILGELAELDEIITFVQYRGNERFEEPLPKYKRIGTHTGRRTFICNALLNGMPAELVMKVTGHSDYKAMKPYVDFIRKDVHDMMDKYIDF